MSHFPEGKVCDIFSKNHCALAVNFNVTRLIVLCHLSYIVTMLITNNKLISRLFVQYPVAIAAVRFAQTEKDIIIVTVYICYRASEITACSRFHRFNICCL